MDEGSLPPDHFCGAVSEVLNSENASFPNPSVRTSSDVAKFVFIVLLTFSIVSLNLLMIAVLHSRNHFRYLRQQPRYFMTSLAITDLAVGVLVTPFSAYSSLHRCWSFGKFFCAIESLFISALFHQSSLSLMIIAIDRYVCIFRPLRYNAIMTRKVCLCMIAATWMTSFIVYSALIYPHAQYFFDPNGIITCEPYYATKDIIIVAVILFYIPPLLIVIYCYTSIFFVAKKQFEMGKLAAISISAHVECALRPKAISRERLRNFHSALSLAAITFGFLVAVTPWTLTELFSSCLERNIPQDLLFVVTWLAVSNSMWNPIIYGVMNSSFRTVAAEVLSNLFCIKYLNKTQQLPNRASQMTLEMVLKDY